MSNHKHLRQVAGVQRLLWLLDRINDPADQIKMLEQRMTTCRQKGRYTFEDDYYLREALTYEPVLAPEGLALFWGLYRAHLPQLVARISVPTLLVYSTKPSEPSRIQRQTERSVKRLLRRNTHLWTIAVTGGHYVHWADASVVSAVADNIRSIS